MNKTAIFSIIVQIALAPLLAGTALADAPPSPAIVRVAPAIMEKLPRSIDAIGTVMPIQSVDLRSRIDSQVMEIKFHDGDTVKQGDVLFVLDDRVLKAQYNELEANITRDEAQAENLKRQLDRAQSLFEKGYNTQQTADDAKAAFDAQAAVVAADKAALENVNVQLGFARIEAPISGRTGTINVTVGNTVKANDTTPLVTLHQIAPIYVQASFPQGDFDAVRDALKGNKAEAVATRTEGKVRETGKLQYMDNAIDPSTGTFATRAVFDNPQENLWPGMLVTLTLSIPQEKPQLSVPLAAVQHGPDGDYVFVIDGGKAVRKTVALDREQGDKAVLDGGVKENDKVAVSNFLKLEDGAPVTVDDAPEGSAK